ncbi:hypothetical protein GMA19_03349 [Paenibacillus polymyxa E681]|uniref:hypothetical protein n=1 Tax=Paenibacillus polymyxa TaxID=1406 RepID=UPI0001E31874|nr:hypothetical protein [Paenibacillus polymyxa]ADM71154.1 hypothetical protein PPE_03336 [Paenibacillus polymyxa E681]QNV58176.1 hypothetical protein GE561_03349 [Paenibacillus polymyxa E681]QNV63013.1 hypothetical protein GMA19_03349 [Paenibacillus polymyxa E681]
MKVKLDPIDIESKHLSWLCIKPMLLAVRGKDLSTKSEMYNQLNEGQKGLYLFYSFHNHTKTLEEFYWFSAYNINELKSWNGIKKGLNYFKDAALSELLDDIETLIVEQNGLKKTVSPTDLENDQELMNDIKILYEKYMDYSETSINRMNDWIKANREEFIETDL